MTIERTCDGRCCSVFYLPKTEPELRTYAGRVKDGPMIRSMIRPLTFDAAAERWEAMWHEPLMAVEAHRNGIPESEPEGHLFTCRHWDEDSGLCQTYETRPAMCRDYPYGEPCAYCGYKIAAPS